jgi:hypothetical protein
VDGVVTFAPLREAKLIRARLEADQLLFDVALGECVFPRDVASFQHVISEALAGHALPGHVDSACIGGLVAESIISPEVSEALRHDDNAWVDAAGLLAEAPAIKDDGRDPVFLRARLFDGEKMVKGRKPGKADAGTFPLIGGYGYKLSLAHRHYNHDQKGDQSLRVGSQGAVYWVDPTVAVTNHANTTDLRFATERDPAWTMASIVLSPVEGLLLPDEPIALTIGRGRVFVLTVALLVIAYAMTVYLSGAGFAKDAWGIVVSLVNTTAVVLLVVLFGKKPV